MIDVTLTVCFILISFWFQEREGDLSPLKRLQKLYGLATAN